MATFAKLTNRFDQTLFIISAYLHDYKQTEFLMDLMKLIRDFSVASDEWDPRYATEYIKIFSDTVLSHTRNDSPDSIFGKEIITKGKYEWRVRVTNLNYSQFQHKGKTDIYIGVCRRIMRDWHQPWMEPQELGCYTFNVTNGQVINGKEISDSFDRKVTKSGDTININLDLEKKRLNCFINGEDVGQSIENLKDGEYRLLVCMFCKSILELK